IIKKICAMPLEPDWQPGQKAGYHVHTTWFILAQLLQQVTSQPFSQYIRNHIFKPLSMNDSHIGMPPDRFDAASDRIALMMDTSKHHPTPCIDPADLKPWITRPRPSGNGHGPVRQLARLYEALLNGGQLNNARILQPETVKLFTARHRLDTFDHTFRHTMDW